MDANEERWATIFSALSEGVIVHDVNGRIAMSNDSAVRILGLTDASMVSVPWMDRQWRAIREDGSPFPVEAHPSVLAFESAQPQTRVIMGVYKPGGALAWLSINTRPIIQDGKPHAVVTTFTDVTAQWAVEDSIRFNQERRKLAVKGAREGIWDWNAETDQVFYSPRWKEILGYEENEIGTTRSEWEDRIHPEDKPSALSALNAHMEGKCPFYEAEFRLRCKDGTWKWLHASGTVVSRCADGQPLRFSGAQIDITARKQAEEALRISEGKFRALVETCRDGFIFGDAEGVILYRSPSYQLFTGYSDEERLGHSGFELVHDEDLATIRQAWATIVSQSTPVLEIHYRLRHKDGTWRWIEASGHNLLNNPDVRAVLWIDRDITERKQAEEALRRSEARFRAVVENSHDGIVFNDADGVILYRSPSYQRITGYSNDERIGQSAFELVHPDDLAAARRAWTRVQSSRSGTGTVPFGNYRILHKNGTWRWVESWAQNLLGNPNVRAVIVASRDITERKVAEEERERLHAQLAQAQKMESIGRLAGGLAHDFNNLLTIINGYSKLALTELNPDDPLSDQLQEIYKAGERAARLTQQLLAFSRKQILQLRVLDLNRVVENMQSMLGRLVGEDIQLNFTFSVESPMVRADPHQLEQVLMNLAANAREAMPGGGRLLIETSLVELNNCHLDSTPEAPVGLYAMLAVSDTGVGMDEATRQRIFEPFFTTKGIGTGLGLSTVQGIVAQSAGFIDVESESERGTSFKIYLPALTDAKVNTENAATARVSGHRGRETVLVVEDQTDVRQFAVVALKAYGYRVIGAANAGEALMICEQEGPQIDLVLTDVVMPDMNGWELMNRLSERRPGIKSLFMSGYADTVIASQRVLDESTHFIEKPFSPQDLAGKIREVLGPPAGPLTY